MNCSRKKEVNAGGVGGHIEKHKLHRVLRQLWPMNLSQTVSNNLLDLNIQRVKSNLYFDYYKRFTYSSKTLIFYFRHINTRFWGGFSQQLNPEWKRSFVIKI